VIDFLRFDGVAVALCGVNRIDALNAGAASVVAVRAGDGDKEAVEVIQGLLSGQGESGLPNLLSPECGVFGPLTSSAVDRFRARNGLAAGAEVDCATLQALVRVPAVSPIASRGYLTLVLDFNYGGLAKILSVVAQMEGAGKFAAMNLNTDRAGLSFGLIQWAQKPGRLAEIVNAFCTVDAGEFVQIFGEGDTELAHALITHLRKSYGGIDATTGRALDAKFDLVNEPWIGRFRAAALFVPFQRAQVQTALTDFRGSLAGIRQYAPQLNSERSAGFILDLANQFGDSGARSIYREVWREGLPVKETLEAMARESVDRVEDAWKAATQARRQHFLTSDFLSDAKFEDAQITIRAARA
jgi:hypothetical protein